MYCADYHMHSRISPDARFSMLELARAAGEAGMDEICFTDHLEPVAWHSGTPRASYDWAALTAEFEAVSAAEESLPGMRLGLELGDGAVNAAATQRIMADAPPLDFIIGSVHMLGEKYAFNDLATLQEPDEQACYDEIENDLELTLATAKWGGFNVLGHLTLPLRYMNERRGFRVSMDGYGAEIEEIFRALIENGCGIEVNTNRGYSPLPGEKWLKLYRRMGGELVTLGSDAHRPADVGKGIREGQALLKACGFTRFCTFTAQKPQWHPL